MIPDLQVQLYIDALLKAMIAAQQPNVSVFFAGKGQKKDPATNVSALQYEIAESERFIGELIFQQGKAPTSTQHIYTEKIREAAERLEILKKEYARLQRQVESPTITAARDRAFSRLLVLGPDRFWQQEPKEVNQFLHALFGKYRLLVSQGKVIGLDIAQRWK